MKIKEGIEILYGMFKAKRGLIRSAQEIENMIIKDIDISGDFTFYPKKQLSDLENTIKDTRREDIEITLKIEQFYEKSGVQTPGIEPQDITKAIEKVK